LFGDADFMDSSGCHNIYEKRIWIGTLRYLKNASHNVMVDAPEELCAIIFNPKKVIRVY